LPSGGRPLRRADLREIRGQGGDSRFPLLLCTLFGLVVQPDLAAKLNVDPSQQ
jgi:hypothetical protein